MSDVTLVPTTLSSHARERTQAASYSQPSLVLINKTRVHLMELKLSARARPTPISLQNLTPHLAPCPSPNPLMPPPYSPELRKVGSQFLAEPNFLFFSKWTRSGCGWEAMQGPQRATNPSHAEEGGTLNHTEPLDPSFSV